MKPIAAKPSAAWISWRGRGYTIFLTGEETVVRLQRFDHESEMPVRLRDLAENPGMARALRETVLRMKLVRAKPSARAIGLDELPGRSNYLTGADRNEWRTHVPNYSRVKYEAVYPGIDVVYYGDQQALEYC